MNDRIFIDEYPVIDRASDARRDFLAYKEISVGNGGYELGETIDDVQYVDNLDHSADFLNPPYLNDMTALKKLVRNCKKDLNILQRNYKRLAILQVIVS